MEPEPRAKLNARAIVILCAVALVVLAIDQFAKFLVLNNLVEGQSVQVLGQLLVFEFVRNAGAAFSIGTGSTWIFSIIAVAVLVFVIWYARRIRSTAWAVVFGLVLGGLLGNLSDRLLRPPGFGVGEVIDFLRIPLLPAIFNLADVAIVSAMVMFLILTIMGVGLDGRRLSAGGKAHGGDDGAERRDASSEPTDAAPGALGDKPTDVKPADVEPTDAEPADTHDTKQ